MPEFWFGTDDHHLLAGIPQPRNGSPERRDELARAPARIDSNKALRFVVGYRKGESRPSCRENHGLDARVFNDLLKNRAIERAAILIRSPTGPNLGEVERRAAAASCEADSGAEQ